MVNKTTYLAGLKQGQRVGFEPVDDSKTTLPLLQGFRHCAFHVSGVLGGSRAKFALIFPQDLDVFPSAQDFMQSFHQFHRVFRLDIKDRAEDDQDRRLPFQPSGQFRILGLDRLDGLQDRTHTSEFRRDDGAHVELGGRDQVFPQFVWRVSVENAEGKVEAEFFPGFGDGTGIQEVGQADGCSKGDDDGERDEIPR